MDIDLNIDNYDLNELLNLFKLDFNFSTDDLKRAKLIVLKTHPDKSQLDKKFFLFFLSAYKILLSIHDFRFKSSNKQSTKYTIEKDEEKELILDKLKVQPNFNKLFNELFEKHKIHDEDIEHGYGDWMKSDENMDFRTTTMSQMNSSFEQKKREIKDIIPFQEIEEFEQSSNLFDLSRDKPTYYSSSMFSNLQYEDLRKAHVETVVPVTHDDYLQRPKFKNVIELQQHPDYKDINPLSLSQANEYLKQRQSYQNKNDVQRAYKLAKQEETSRKANQEWMSGFKQLTNSI